MGLEYVQYIFFQKSINYPKKLASLRLPSNAHSKVLFQIIPSV